MNHWTTSNIPPQDGRTVVVTGTGGLGFEDAAALARAGANVIIAGRNPKKGAEAVARIRQSISTARVSFMPLDLANLDSIAALGESLRRSLDRVDVLINNAAVMTPPIRQVTADGFELQFGTNHLGHFALTAQLMPLLLNGRQPRVISLSSVAARGGAINFDDLQSQQSYKPMPVYSQSKLACLMFALELQRRSDAARWGIESLAAHPGISRTELLPNGAGPRSVPGMLRRFMWFLFQPAAQGALPTLYAATAPQARGGEYYGPDKLGETRGHPAIARVPPQALNRAHAARLWIESERLTGMAFPSLPSVARPALIPSTEAAAHRGPALFS